MITGGNITDISQLDGMKLIVKYWSSFDPKDKTILNSYNINIINDSIIFVGDVHGDINQFIAPLVFSGYVKIKDNIREIKTKNTITYIPDYEVNTEPKIKIIYLGDITDEWIFAIPISFILKDILTKLPNNIFYIYGNHDLALIGRYHLFVEKKLNFALDLPSLWNTLKKELNYIQNLKIFKQTALLDDEPTKGYEFIYNYLTPLFDNLFYIFSKNMGQISLSIHIMNKPYMVSHTTWTQQALQQLIDNNSDSNHKSDRPSDNIESQLQPLISSTSKNINNYIQLIQSVINNKCDEIDYQSLSEAVNKIFITKSRLYVSKNLITYTRLTKNVILNHIVGHSIGAEFRDQNVNSGLSTYYHERESKLKPSIINGKIIYYFDFGCSAGYDHDEIGRPDFVYSNKAGLFVSNLPAFSFIISNNRDSLLVLKDKTPRTGNKIVIK